MAMSILLLTNILCNNKRARTIASNIECITINKIM